VGRRPTPRCGDSSYPDAKALIGIDWARIRQLQAGAMIREKWLTAGACRPFRAWNCWTISIAC
jgi:hypothetical protein